MKKVILFIIIALLVIPSLAIAQDHNKAGVKLDAPELIKITKNISAGVEAQKGIMAEIGYNDFGYIEDDKDFSGYVKITYKGTLLDFSK